MILENLGEYFPQTIPVSQVISDELLPSIARFLFCLTLAKIQHFDNEY